MKSRIQKILVSRPPVATPLAALEAPRRLDYIDAARGWAFLFVLTVHAFGRAPVDNYLLKSLAASGNYGVQLFFIASALTLCMSFEARRPKDDRPVTFFLIRRFFRIAPLFYFGIIFYLIAWGTGPREFAPDGIHARQVALTAGFLHGWWPDTINSVVPGGWSIAVEMNFYLCLPLLFVLLTTLRRALVAFVISIPLTVGISVLTVKLLRSNFDSGPVAGFTYYWLPRQFPVFLLGIVVFHLSRQSHDSASAKRLALFGVLGLLATSVVGDRLPLSYLAHSICFAVILVALRSVPLKFLVNPATRFLGTISFSAYICHFFALDVTVATMRTLTGLPRQHPFLMFLILYLLALALTCAFSFITYRLIEVPGQNLGRLIIARPSRRGGAATTLPAAAEGAI
jgi:peptidoglycan/LPS O-acetylase OafA/YrhL